MINAVILKVAKSQLVTFPLLESFFINSPSSLVERVCDGFWKYRNKIFFECYDEFFRIESDCNCVDVGCAFGKEYSQKAFDKIGSFEFAPGLFCRCIADAFDTTFFDNFDFQTYCKISIR